MWLVAVFVFAVDELLGDVCLLRGQQEAALVGGSPSSRDCWFTCAGKVESGGVAGWGGGGGGRNRWQQTSPGRRCCRRRIVAIVSKSGVVVALSRSNSMGR